MFYPSSEPSGAGKGIPPPSQKDDNITGKFDPTALERGAKALKEIDSSPNALKAFEITKMQEQTKKQQLQNELERMQVAKHQLAAQKAQTEGEEHRKTLQQQSEQERRTAQYKAQMELELYQQKLKDQQSQNDEWLRKQQAQFQQQEELRKKTEVDLENIRRQRMVEQSRLDKENAVAKAEAEARGRTLERKANADVYLRELRAQAAEDRKTRLESIEKYFSSVRGIIDNKQEMYTIVGSLVAIAIGVYGARSTASVAQKFIEARMGKPPLVRETSRWTFSQYYKNMIPFGVKKKLDVREHIVLPADLTERLQWTTNSLVNTKRHDIYCFMDRREPEKLSFPEPWQKKVA
eukprot:GHVL01041092.1.p2 GENE.GHVL01041092.1~~GHVL01041092.1.p2  ORF type:complete len:350 (+),score=64.82 GHVL01041092.1:2137-3186(+)